MLYYDSYQDFLKDLDWDTMPMKAFLRQHPWAKDTLGFDDDAQDPEEFPVLTKDNGTEMFCHSEGLLYCPGDGSDDRWSDDPDIKNAWLVEFGISLFIPEDMVKVVSCEYLERDQYTRFNLENGETITVTWDGVVTGTDCHDYEHVAKVHPDGIRETIGFIKR